MTKVRTFLKFPRAALSLSAAAKDVLLRYIDRADDKTGETFVSAETIAAELGVQVRQVQKLRKGIIAAGVMVPAGSRRSKNGFVTKRFRIIYKASSQDVSDASSKDVSRPPKRPLKASKASSQDVSDASSKDARSRIDIYQENDQEVEGLFEPEEVPDDLTIAKAAWNDLASALGLPQVSHLTDGRKSKLRARLKEAGGIAGWNIALEKVRAAEWMHGANDFGWRVNFDYLLRPDKFAQVMEGVHDQRHGRRRRSVAEENRAAVADIIARADREASSPHHEQEET